jgi:predicted protein tyrosine phosphatase
MRTATTLRLTNISKQEVGKIPNDAPLISISDKYSSGAAIPNKDNRPLLRVDFFPGDHTGENERDHCMRPEVARQIFDFVNEHMDKGLIYVNCGEGRIRSYTVCETLETLLLDKGVRRDSSLASIKHGVLDRYTYRQLVEYYERYIDDGEES